MQGIESEEMGKPNQSLSDKHKLERPGKLNFGMFSMLCYSLGICYYKFSSWIENLEMSEQTDWDLRRTGWDHFGWLVKEAGFM